ncbi:hypothetical protein VIBNIMADA3020_410031 [Vibrio nigripulchritudo MADA3020]|nr:hypothetical protein VIBNIMADA3020_410031 [Vibrio nigripulchritudo MADA3020]CCN55890.1 hypothetical protein VIBNIMADA3021_840162 [Vibrio nigripulchritudo MADA3021]
MAVLGPFDSNVLQIVHESWFVAAGTVALYLMDVQRNAEKQLNKNRT